MNVYAIMGIKVHEYLMWRKPITEFRPFRNVLYLRVMHTTENIHLPVSNIRTQYRSNHRFIRDFVSSPQSFTWRWNNTV